MGPKNGHRKYTNSCRISNIFALGALGFQQFSDPTKASDDGKRFLPQRRPSTSPHMQKSAPGRAPKTAQDAPNMPQDASKTPQEAPRGIQSAMSVVSWVQKMDIGNIQIPAGFPIFSLSGRWVSNNFRSRPSTSPHVQKSAPGRPPKTAQDVPIMLQDASKTAQEASKT